MTSDIFFAASTAPLPTSDVLMILTPGSFLVLFPGDAHRPGMAVEGPEKVSRIVFKILAGNDG